MTPADPEPCVVVPLARVRHAHVCARALESLLHSPEWLIKVAVEVAAGEVRVIALVPKVTRAVEMAMPRTIDGIPVEARAVKPAARRT